MNRKACGILLVMMSTVANALLTAFHVHHPFSDLTLAIGLLGIVLSAEDKRLSILAALGGVSILLFAFLGIYDWSYGVTLALIVIAAVAVLIYDKFTRRKRAL